jgi:hypothetical protein
MPRLHVEIADHSWVPPLQAAVRCISEMHAGDVAEFGCNICTRNADLCFHLYTIVQRSALPLESFSRMEALRQSPGALLSRCNVRPCTDYCKGLSLVKRLRRRGVRRELRRRTEADLSCCSVTTADSSQFLSTAFAEPFTRDVLVSVIIMLASAGLILILSFLRSRGLLDRVSIRGAGCALCLVEAWYTQVSH